MDNLISTCFVIEILETGYIDPTIYLTQPQSREGVRVHMFEHPWAAKHFLRMWMNGVEITVSKYAV